MITGASLTSTLGWVLALALLAGYAEPSRAQDAEPESFTTTTIPADDQAAKSAAMKRVADKAAAKAAAEAAKAAQAAAAQAPDPIEQPVPAARPAHHAPAAAGTPTKKAGRAPVAVPPDPPVAAERPVETGSIGPPAPPIVSTKFTDWILDCMELDGKQKCGLRQTVTDGKGRRIVQIVARHSGKTAYLEVNVPVGISIPFGVALQLSDTGKFTARLADCDTIGCRAVAPLDDKTLAEMKAAKALAVIFQDSKSGRVLKVNGSLNGFQRRSWQGYGGQPESLTLPLCP